MQISRLALRPGASAGALRCLSSVPEFLLTAPATTCSDLANGVSVASEPNAGAVATVGVFIDAGSRLESAEMSGATHLLQTAALKEKAAAIEALGGVMNAYTTRETTVYTATVLKEKAAAAVGLLGEIVTVPLSSDESLAAAKETVLAQVAAMTSSPEEALMEGMHEMAYMDTSLAAPIVGSAATVSGFSKSDLAAPTTALTGSMVKIAGAGIEHAQLSELATAALGKLSASSASSVEVAMEPAIWTGSDKHVRMDSYPLAHVALAYEGPALTSEYALPATLAQYLLGSYEMGATTVPCENHATRLQIDLGEQKAAKAFTPFYTPYKDTGLWGIYLVSPDNRLQDATWYTMMNLVRLMYKTTDEELDRAKLAMKVAALKSLSTPAGVCEDLGKQMISYGRVMSTAELFARIDAIDAATVKDTVYQIVHDNDHVLTAVGPIHELPDYNYIRRRSYWLTR